MSSQANGDGIMEPAQQKEQNNYANQSEHLAQLHPKQENEKTGSTQAVKAKFVTPLDPVIVTEDGGRLPVVPVEEAVKLNELKEKAEEEQTNGVTHSCRKPRGSSASRQDELADAPLRDAIPSSRTNPLFPPLPLYGPPSPLRTVQVFFFRITSSVLSLLFLLSIVAGAIIGSIPRLLRNARQRAVLKNPKKQRPFYEEEVKRREERKAADRAWRREQTGARTPASGEKYANGIPQDAEFVPTEGGPDPLCVDVGYYARRVGLDVEVFEVQTEDGFIIELWHIFNPREYKQRPSPHRQMHGPEVSENTSKDSGNTQTEQFPMSEKKYPVLMIHGLLQSAGAFCCNDDDSLAFYLAKSGYDVWLGQNRCGFQPKHTLLEYGDPRMWAWNIRQMGVLDLPALVSRVLAETSFPKLALIAHSQGTTETFVALAKEQRPEMGEKISVFCALAPAAYAGPLINKIYLKVMRLVSPGVFRIIFGIHAFIPLMMFAHRILPARSYSWMAYHVFSYLFSWSDSRWDRGLRDRLFQWAPVYVSAESMRWWLGRECFAKQKCILATREEGKLEDKEDEEDDEVIRRATMDREPHVNPRRKLQRNLTSFHCLTEDHIHHDSRRGRFAWYNEKFPPLALWIGGSDDLVDGRRLLRRFDRGREPYVKIVHRKIIDEYEHLDVIWAMDAIEKVGKEVREVIWRTVDAESALMCQVPTGCQKDLMEDPDINDEVPMMHSGGRLRMASISESVQLSSADLKLDGSTMQDAVNPLEPMIEVEDEYDLNTEKTRTADRRLSEIPFTDLQERGNPLD